MKPKMKLGVDRTAICKIDHACVGQSDVSESCCARYDVTVTTAEMNRIFNALPEAAKLCPHLKTEGGYDNVFEDSEKGLHSIETDEDGLCAFAFREDGLIRCALHAVEIRNGWPLGTVKPAVCILWPLTFSEKGDCLTLHDDALGCACSSPRKKPSNEISPELRETIRHFGGEV